MGAKWTGYRSALCSFIKGKKTSCTSRQTLMKKNSTSCVSPVRRNGKDQSHSKPCQCATKTSCPFLRPRRDLLSLCTSGVIPAEHQDFFRKLSSSSSVGDKLPQPDINDSASIDISDTDQTHIHSWQQFCWCVITGLAAVSYTGTETDSVITYAHQFFNSTSYLRLITCTYSRFIWV